jgi:hypothetical protein
LGLGGCGPIEESAPPATPVIVVHQQPPHVIQPAPEAKAPPQSRDELAPRPRLSRTITLGQGNDHPVFEGPSRVQGALAQGDPHSTTFRYSPYYNFGTPAYYGPTYRSYYYGGGGYVGGFLRAGGYGDARRTGPAPPPSTPAVGGDWPRAPIGGGGGRGVGGGYPQYSPSMSLGPGVGGGGAGAGAGGSVGVFR